MVFMISSDISGQLDYRTILGIVAAVLFVVILILVIILAVRHHR